MLEDRLLSYSIFRNRVWFEKFCCGERDRGVRRGRARSQRRKLRVLTRCQTE